MKKKVGVFSAVVLCLLLATVSMALAAGGAGEGWGNWKTAKTITEGDIEALLEEADRVIQSKDVNGVARLLADDVIITMKIPGPNGVEVMTFGKEEYMSYVEQSWSIVHDYSYLRKDVRINISPDGRIANVRDVIVETATMTDGRTFSSVTSQESLIEKRSGRLVTTLIDAVVTSLDISD